MPESPHIDADGFVFFQANDGTERRQFNARVGVGLTRTEYHIEIGGIGRRQRRRIVCPNRESRLMLWQAPSEERQRLAVIVIDRFTSSQEVLSSNLAP